MDSGVRLQVTLTADILSLVFQGRVWAHRPLATTSTRRKKVLPVYVPSLHPSVKAIAQCKRGGGRKEEGGLSCSVTRSAYVAV